MLPFTQKKGGFTHLSGFCQLTKFPENEETLDVSVKYYTTSPYKKPKLFNCLEFLKSCEGSARKDTMPQKIPRRCHRRYQGGTKEIVNKNSPKKVFFSGTYSYLLWHFLGIFCGTVSSAAFPLINLYFKKILNLWCIGRTPSFIFVSQHPFNFIATILPLYLTDPV